jgi:hypothetical protein
MLLPDGNEVTTSDWDKIVNVYETLVGDRYIESYTSNFDFVTAMLTFVDEDFSHDMVNGLRLKYEQGHLRGSKIPARWIHRMIFQYIEDIKQDISVTPDVFFQNRRGKWMEAYKNLSYEEKKNKAWISYILTNNDESKLLFSDSYYGKLTNKDGNLWLYLKTNRNERDILLSNKRKIVIKRLTELVPQWKYDHDIVESYPDIPFLIVVFASNVIWVGIRKDSNVEVPASLPGYMWSDDWHKARAWFHSDNFDLNNYYENDSMSFEKYIETLSQELRAFCLKFISDLKLGPVMATSLVENN